MSHRKHRGFVLLEVLFMLVVGSLALIMVGRLFKTTARVHRDGTAATATLRSQQQWLGLMRADAWSATRIDTSDSATFALAEGPAQWAWADATLTRTLGDDVRRWPLERAIRWGWDGRSLVVVGGDAEVPLATPSVRDGEAP